MPWLKLVHLATLLLWCGALLYLPALIAAGTRRSEALFYRDHAHLTRMVFIFLATPAALLAIGTGTALFLTQGTMAPWLILKLTAVAAMVLCHAACGVLILRIERSPQGSVVIQCVLAGLCSTLLIVTTLWLVLGKPF